VARHRFPARISHRKSLHRNNLRPQPHDRCCARALRLLTVDDPARRDAPAPLSPLPTMYIDPATGSLVLQVIAASAFAVLATFSRLRNALRAFFARVFTKRNG
jgi:hypothetical protein